MPASVGAGRGALVEAAGLELHRLGLLAHARRGRAGATSQTGSALDEAFDVLPADERDVLAEAGDRFDQAAAVAVLLDLHAAEDLGGGGVVGLRPSAKSA